MPKVLCLLPNAGHNINGVAFTPHGSGVISAEISAERVAEFCLIPGYVPVVDEAPAEIHAKAEHADTVVHPADHLAETVAHHAAEDAGKAKAKATGGKPAAPHKETT